MGAPSAHVEDRADRARERAPGRGRGLQLLAAGARQLVVLGIAVVVRRGPPRLDPAAALEAMQRRVERSLLNLDDARGDLVEPLGDRPAMLRFERQGLEDE